SRQRQAPRQHLGRGGAGEIPLVVGCREGPGGQVPSGGHLPLLLTPRCARVPSAVRGSPALCAGLLTPHLGLTEGLLKLRGDLTVSDATRSGDLRRARAKLRGDLTAHRKAG